MKAVTLKAFAVATLVAGSFGVHAGDPAPSSAASTHSAPLSGTQMGHSPADGKAMRMMPTPGAQAHEPSGPVKPGEYSTMGHSEADGKAMRHMDNGKPAESPKGKTKYSTMGHSAADGKAMRHMTGPDKTVEVDNGPAEKTDNK